MLQMCVTLCEAFAAPCLHLYRRATLALGHRATTAVSASSTDPVSALCHMPRMIALYPSVWPSRRKAGVHSRWVLLRMEGQSETLCPDDLRAPAPVHVTDRRESSGFTVAEIAGNFLPTFGIAPVIGRNFLPEEDLPNGPRVALISYALWHTQFTKTLTS